METDDHFTMTTYPTVGAPTRSPQERTREEWVKDNKPNAKARELGLGLCKPLNPNDYPMYKGIF